MSALPSKAEHIGMSALGQKRTHAPQQTTGCLGQMLTDFRQEFARAVGFRHIVITAGRIGSFVI